MLKGTKEPVLTEDSEVRMEFGNTDFEETRQPDQANGKIFTTVTHYKSN